MLSVNHEVAVCRDETVVVTGVCGFVGFHLAQALLDRGATVIGVDQRGPGSGPRVVGQLRRLQGRPGFRLVVASLQDAGRANELVGCLRDVGVVFHLAAATDVRASWGEGFADHAVSTVLGTQRLLDACQRAGVPRVVVASSSHVYGTTETTTTTGLVREDAPLSPASPYGVAKLAAERLAVAYAQRGGSGMNVVALRYFTTYGPRCHDAMVVMRLFNAAVTGRSMPLYGDGTQPHSWTHVDDLVAATVQAGQVPMTAGGAEVVNVAGPERASLIEVADLVGRITGRPVPLENAGVRAGDASSTCADLTRAHRVLGFIPQVGLTEGLWRQWRWLNSDDNDQLTQHTSRDTGGDPEVSSTVASLDSV